MPSFGAWGVPPRGSGNVRPVFGDIVERMGRCGNRSDTHELRIRVIWGERRRTPVGSKLPSLRPGGAACLEAGGSRRSRSEC
jgi:hypothetical protein